MRPNICATCAFHLAAIKASPFPSIVLLCSVFSTASNIQRSKAMDFQLKASEGSPYKVGYCPGGYRNHCHCSKTIPAMHHAPAYTTVHVQHAYNPLLARVAPPLLPRRLICPLHPGAHVTKAVWPPSARPSCSGGGRGHVPAARGSLPAVPPVLDVLLGVSSKADCRRATHRVVGSARPLQGRRRCA